MCYCIQRWAVYWHKKCHKTVKYQCSKALPAHMSDRWLHVTWPTQGFRDRKRATLYPPAGEQSLVHLYVNSQTTKIAIQPAWRCLWLRFRARGTQSTKSRAEGPLYRENSLRPLRVYHTKEKQGKYSQLIIPTGILCCRAKQYCHLRHVRYSCCEMANERYNHSLLCFLQPGNCCDGLQNCVNDDTLSIHPAPPCPNLDFALLKLNQIQAYLYF